MPLTVVTLTNAPKSLRGDLTKWMQEIATGVYVGNFNVKVREKLWERIVENIDDGQATISYAYRNEIGYKFDTINTQREAIDYDGLPLVLIREKVGTKKDINKKKGFSKAAKFRKAKKFSQTKKKENTPYVVLDIETDGLDYKKDNIIEIGAIKLEGKEEKYFQSLVKVNKKLPNTIKKLTKIDDKMLEEDGRDLKEVLEELVDFIGAYPIVGYNLKFDIMFINKSLKKLNKEKLLNKKYDLLNYVKKEKKFLSSYKLENVVKEYGIEKDQTHRALEDAKLTYELSDKVNKFQEDLKY